MINLKSGSNHEIFLFEAELFSLEKVVIGIKNSRDVLGSVTIQNSLDIITIVNWNLNKNQKWVIFFNLKG